jgi:hypothetical protein
MTFRICSERAHPGPDVHRDWANLPLHHLHGPPCPRNRKSVWSCVRGPTWPPDVLSVCAGRPRRRRKRCVRCLSAMRSGCDVPVRSQRTLLQCRGMLCVQFFQTAHAERNASEYSDGTPVSTLPLRVRAHAEAGAYGHACALFCHVQRMLGFAHSFTTYSHASYHTAEQMPLSVAPNSADTLRCLPATNFDAVVVSKVVRAFSLLRSRTLVAMPRSSCSSP